MTLADEISETVRRFREYVRTITHYQEALNLMAWDLRTGAPKKGVPLRAEAIGTLSSEVFRMSTSDEMGQYLDTLEDPSVFPRLDSVTQATVRVLRKEFERSRRIPPDQHRAFVVLVSQAESAWEDAKQSADFASFRPYLEQIVEFQKEFAEAWGYTGHRYDALLDKYEPGTTVAQLDPLFEAIGRDTVQLLQAIVNSGRRPAWQASGRRFEVVKQRELSLYMLRAMGYDFDAGRLDETVHPFQSTINRYDTRVTTRFVEDDLFSSLFGTIHEGGHALYEQGISTDLIGTPLCTGASMGIHESQSRFWENMVGRSRAFWEHHYPTLLRIFPTQFADVSLEDFYRAINDVQPSLIRIDADEVTYNLHIIVRYELEKALIAGDLKVADLPGAWNEKMKAYLGIVPRHDGEGVLQDVHWAGGDFGYFPSYALGNLYAAQFLEAMERQVPDWKDELRTGRVDAILEWQREHIHRYGRMLEPADIVLRATGRPLESGPWMRYLRTKYGALYGI
jgi:carboxypeptidase Taq